MSDSARFALLWIGICIIVIAIFLGTAGVVKIPQALDKTANLEIKPTKFVKRSWVNPKGGGESFVYSIYGLNAINQEVFFNLPGNDASQEILSRMKVSEPATLWVQINDFRYIVQIEQSQKLILDYAKSTLVLQKEAERFFKFALFALLTGLALITASRFKHEKTT